MKRIAILGATGSIGTQTLDVARFLRDRLEVVAMAAGSNGPALKQLAQDWPDAKLALFDESAAQQHGLPGGMEAIVDLVTDTDVDLVVVSVAGVIGLVPTLAAIQAGKQIALASKEVLVAGGELAMRLVAENKTLMTPIDSEHSAVFQCIQGYRPDHIQEVILTASGGPFRGKSRAELQAITPQQALNHPTWSMGGKITIDSATLMNKGLEMIEAKWLFGVTMDQVKVVVHPQSILHSLVKFTDGSVLGQMGWPNMRLPIQYALMYPERPPSGLKNWDPTDSPNLTFEAPDTEVFRALNLAREAERIGQTMPCVLNAANEQVVALFLDGKVGFTQIDETVEQVMSDHTPVAVGLESLIETDKWARARTKERVGLS